MQTFKGGINLKIVIVGAGTGGTNILNSLLNVKDLDIVLVVDKNLNSPGILLAKKFGLRYSESTDSIDPNSTDIIIEATGSEKVAIILREKFQNSCTVMDSKAALLVMTLVRRDMENLDKMNKQICLIHDISSKLLISTENSKKHIENTGSIAQYVNEISEKQKY